MSYVHLEKIRCSTKDSVEKFNMWQPSMSYFESISAGSFVYILHTPVLRVVTVLMPNDGLYLFKRSSIAGLVIYSVCCV